jgi:hypothetical protein
MNSLDTYIATMMKCNGINCNKKYNCLRYLSSDKNNFLKEDKCDMYFKQNKEISSVDETTLNNFKNIFGM